MKKFSEDLLRFAVQAYGGQFFKVIETEDGKECSVFVEFPADKRAAFDTAMKQTFAIESPDWAKNGRNMFDLKIQDEFSFEKSICDFYNNAPNKSKYSIGQENGTTDKVTIMQAVYKDADGYDDYVSLLERLKAAKLKAGEIIIHPVYRQAQSTFDYHLLYKENNGPTWLINAETILDLSNLRDILLIAPTDLWYAIDVEYFKQFDLKTLADGIAKMSPQKRGEFYQVYFPEALSEFNKTTYSESRNYLLDAIIVSQNASKQSEDFQPKVAICKRVIENGIPDANNTIGELQPYYDRIFKDNLDWYINFNFNSQKMESLFNEAYARKFPTTRDETELSESTREKFGFIKKQAKQTKVFIAPQQPQQQDIPTWLICGGLLAFTTALIKYPKQTVAVGVTATAAWFGYQRYVVEAPVVSNDTNNGNTANSQNINKIK